MRQVRVACSLALMLVLIGATRAVAQTTAPPDGRVVLPVDEYRALREKAVPPPPLPPALPVDATLTRVDYELRADAESVSGRALMTIDVLKDGWTRVQIPAGLMVRDARLDGQPVSLVEGPPAHVWLSRAGRFILVLDMVGPIVSSGGTDAMTIPAASSPISKVTLVLPKSGVNLTLSGGFIADHSESANESRWTAFARPNQPLTLSWKRKVDDRRADQPLRVRGRITEVAGFSEDTCQITVAVRVEVLQGVARAIAVAIPAGLVVNQVNGATVGDWDVTNGALQVRLLEPTMTEVSFVVLGEARVPREGTIVVPLVRMPSAERESGGVAVDVAGAGEIAERQARGLEPADPSDLGDLVSSRESPSMIAFRLRPLAGSDARSLSVTIVRYTPQAVLIANVEEARYHALASEDGRLLVEARYAVRNNQRSFLKVTLPAGATVWSAEIAGRPIRPGVAEGEAVLLPLDKGELQMTLPKMDVPVGIVEWEVFVPDSYAVRAVDGNVIDRRTLEHSGRGTAESEATGVVTAIGSGVGGGTGRGSGGGIGQGVASGLGGGVYAPGQIRGRVTDKSGAPLPGVSVVLEAKDARRNGVTGADGMFVVSDVPSGEVTVTAQASGFTLQRRSFAFNRQQAQHVDLTLDVGGTTETVTATGESPVARPVSPSTNDALKSSLEPAPARPYIEPSQNVINLQRRAAGVLPVRVDVPRAGTSHQFVKPLVVDQETVVQFRYKRR